jgi:photosystem II stability/assembly factor-like uncharacterized protein
MSQKTTTVMIALLCAAGCARAGTRTGAGTDVTPPAQAAASPIRTEQQSGTDALLIAVSPVSDDVAWVSGTGGTWLRTIDGGATWQSGRVPGADSLQFRDVHALDAQHAWLLSIGNGEDSRIYRTEDAGAHWTLQFVNHEPQGFYDCMDFWDDNRGVVIGDAVDGQLAVLTTYDGGNHWSRVPSTALPPALPGEGSFAASGTCAITEPGGHAWIAMNTAEHARLLHSSDYGRSWTVDTVPLTTRAGTGGESISFRDPQHGVVLGGGTTAAAGDVFTVFTSDGGRTWTQRSSPPLRRGMWGGVYVSTASDAAQSASSHVALVGVGPDGAAYSRDDGMTWTVIDTFNYWSVGFASPRAGWAVGQNGRITKLSNF